MFIVIKLCPVCLHDVSLRQKFIFMRLYEEVENVRINQ